MDMVDFKVRLRLIKGKARQGGKAWLGALTSCGARVTSAPRYVSLASLYFFLDNRKSNIDL